MSARDVVQMNYALQRDAFTLNVQLEIPLRGITGIFGASGAGKTTLLRCIAGLERAPGGELTVGGEAWQNASTYRPVHRRAIGYVFQEPRLFRHLDVRGNIEYAMSRRNGAGSASFADIVDLLELSALLSRRPGQLSGGEAQRVAIARALLCAARFVLMDEPLASLDDARKQEILPFLDRLHAASLLPIIYVSHSIAEICRLCDQLVVLDAGCVVANGALDAVLLQSELPLLSGDEAGAVIAGEIAALDTQYELTKLRFPGGELWLPGRLGSVGDRLRLRIRANDVSLCRDRPARTSMLNVLDVVIAGIPASDGPRQLLRLSAGPTQFLARITRRSRAELNLQVGDRLYAQVKAVAVRAPNPA